MTGSQVRVLFAAPRFQKFRRIIGARVHARGCVTCLTSGNRLPGIVSASTSRGDTNMRKFILIAGFVLASAAAHAGDRSLSLGGNETQAAPAPAKATDVSKSAEAAETPKYVERPAVVEPKAETSKPETNRAETATPRTGKAARTQRYATRPAGAGPGSPAARRAAMMSRSAGAHRMRYGIRARIIMALHRHGIYW
jgi:hypothetical protein